MLASQMNGFTAFMEQAISSEVNFFVNYEPRKPGADTPLTQLDWEIIQADIERQINDRFCGMLGYPTPVDVINRLAQNPRPLMIVARELTSLAYVELRYGLKPDIGTAYGVGEFLYPKVKERMAQQLDQQVH